MAGCVWGLALVASSVVYVCFGHVLGGKHLSMSYKEIGDLNIGGLFSISQLTGGKFCKITPTTKFFSALQYMEVLAHTVRLVNMNDSLLPGIKLGFVFLDVCSNVQSAMVQATRFLPRSSPSEYRETNETNVLPSYRVVGVLVSPKSHATVSISILYGGIGIPIIGFTDITSDLKEEHWYPTFFRVSPSKSVIITAMLKFMRVNNFTYFSVALQNSLDAELLQNIIRLESAKNGMCVSKVLLVTRHSDFERAYDELRQDRVKVVVAFVNSETAELLLTAAEIRGNRWSVIWIVTDSWMHLLKSGRMHKNAFLFSSSTVEVNSSLYSFEYIESNPWYQLALSSPFCKNLTCVPSQLKSRLMKGEFNKGDIRDAVLTFAHGLHNLITDKCPGASGSNATACFDEHSADFVSYLRSVSFQGVSGEVLFDSKRVKIMNLNIYQEISFDGNYTEIINIAKYYVATDLLLGVKSLHLDLIRFAIDEAHKEAFCQTPCNVSEHKSPTGCCWVCRACQDDEIVTDNETACSKCPPLQWPAMHSGRLSVCQDILPAYLDWFDPLHIVFLAVGATCAVRTVYLISNVISDITTPVVPFPVASLSLRMYKYCQLVAILLGLGSVPIFLHHPTVPHCYAAQILFVFSLLLEYTVMLLRSVHIYQKCFSNDVEGEQPSWIRKWTYCIAVYLLSILQMITFTLLLLRYPIQKIKQQPMVGENFVEVFCDLPVPLAVTFLVSAIFLLMLCAVVSLKTEDHELGKTQGRFAPTYVYVSLVMWVVFMPTYFTAFRGGMRMYYQVIAVLLNASVSTILNFTPEFMLLLCAGKRNSNRLHHHGRSSIPGPSFRASFRASLRSSFRSSFRGSFGLRASGGERNTLGGSS